MYQFESDLVQKIPIEVEYQLKVFEVKNTWYTKVSTCMSTYSMNLDIEILFNRSWLKYETTKDKLENM